jgi:DNA polymerase I-like protein with 3'-5' exonuclease and polymerase domains
MGSLYARHNRWKHLQQSDPLTYSGMDALATFDIWQQLQRELARDSASRELYEHELKPLLPHVMARPSIRLDAMHIAQAAQELKREQEELVKRGQAVAGWPLSISSPDQVARWLRLKTDAPF